MFDAILDKWKEGAKSLSLGDVMDNPYASVDDVLFASADEKRPAEENATDPLYTDYRIQQPNAGGAIVDKPKSIVPEGGFQNENFQKGVLILGVAIAGYLIVKAL